jgi:hypothetical protein
LRRLLWLSGLLACSAGSLPARADRVLVDRVAVRFTAPETGGVRSPRFIYERMLAFEARLEALSDPDRRGTRLSGYRERHVRAAMERHVAETLLASLHIEPEPKPAQISRMMDAARSMLEQKTGGREAVADAQRAEGIEQRELSALLRRRARASLYLDRMIAPMLAPSDAELRSVYRSGQSPFSDLPFDQAAGALRRWYVSRRLGEAVEAFFQTARSRVDVVVLDPDY